MFFLLLLLAQGPDTPGSARPPFDHVLLISVDGLRSDALLVDGGDWLPNFQRLMGGAHTLNARCDPGYSVTLPNHVGMLTGRLVDGAEGHRWSTNDAPPSDSILRDAHGNPIAGIFHRTSAADVDDALIAAKGKFRLFTQSWNQDPKAPLIDLVFIRDDPTAQVDLALQMLDPDLHPRSFVFLHFRAPDAAGHDSGWDLTPGSPYLKAVRAVDKQLGRILELLDANPDLRAATAIVLTADHGGGVPFRNHHGLGMAWVNTIIPFFVDLPGGHAAELYAVCADRRRDPGIDPVANDPEQLPPIRNSDAANLCLALLGLDPIADSTVNPGQDIASGLFRSTPAAPNR